MKEYRIHNKSDRPDNVVEQENEIFFGVREAGRNAPSVSSNLFYLLKGNVLPQSRLAYLRDIHFFFEYLVRETTLTEADTPDRVTLDELNQITAMDINIFLDYCRKYKVETEKGTVIYENNNKTISRKKSSISVMFKQLYRDGLLDNNITDGFDPIRVPGPGEKEIKALQDDEVMVMLDAVSSGTHLTDRERIYWEKTKLRDKAILILFLTYGLRLSELQQLNVSSFNFSKRRISNLPKAGKRIYDAHQPLRGGCGSGLSGNERNQITVQDERDEDALFLSLQGKRMTQRAIRELVKKYTSIPLHTGRKRDTVRTSFGLPPPPV